jgi:hypothetical protein
MKQEEEMGAGASVGALMGREPSFAETRLILPFANFRSAGGRQVPRR